MSRRISYIVFLDGSPVSACCVRSADDALAYARHWQGTAPYRSLVVRPEADCTADDLEALDASESARCAGWTTARAAGVDGSLSIA